MSSLSNIINIRLTSSLSSSSHHHYRRIYYYYYYLSSSRSLSSPPGPLLFSSSFSSSSNPNSGGEWEQIMKRANNAAQKKSEKNNNPSTHTTPSDHPQPSATSKSTDPKNHQRSFNQREKSSSNNSAPYPLPPSSLSNVWNQWNDRQLPTVPATSSSSDSSSSSSFSEQSNIDPFFPEEDDSILLDKHEQLLSHTNAALRDIIIPPLPKFTLPPNATKLTRESEGGKRVGHNIIKTKDNQISSLFLLRLLVLNKLFPEDWTASRLSQLFRINETIIKNILSSLTVPVLVKDPSGMEHALWEVHGASMREEKSSPARIFGTTLLTQHFMKRVDQVWNEIEEKEKNINQSNNNNDNSNNNNSIQNDSAKQ